MGGTKFPFYESGLEEIRPGLLTNQLCSRRRPYQGGYCIGACCRPQVLYTYNQAGYKCKGPDSSSIFLLIINMGGYLCKDTKVFKAKNFHQQSLDDKSFSVLNVHGASGMGGALLVILILLLATPGYSLASAESRPSPAWRLSSRAAPPDT